MTNLGIYKAVFSTPFGYFLFAVESTAMDAKGDLFTVAISGLNCHASLIRIGKVRKSNRTLLKGMIPVGKTKWAWMKRV